jgi:hypothetical protein
MFGINWPAVISYSNISFVHPHHEASGFNQSKNFTSVERMIGIPIT